MALWHKVFIVCLLTFTFDSATAMAAESLRHPELQRFEEQGGKVEYLGTSYGLDGWLLTKDDLEPAAVYTTKEGGLVRGMLIAPDGKVETMTQLMALKSRLDGSQEPLPGANLSYASRAEKFYAEVAKAPWGETGSKDAPYIYLFMNVTCADCQAYWKELQPLVASGKLRVRLSPFGSKPANRDGGAALLSSKDPGQSWTEFINGKADVLSADKIVGSAREAVNFNGGLLHKWGIESTPFTIYRRITDGKITVINGKPDNLMLVLADLIAPAQKNSELQKEKAK